MTKRRRLALSLAALALAGLLGCGKKGPPLPPLEGSIPRIADLEMRQVGEETRGYFTIPVRPDQDEVDYITTAVELWRRPAEQGASEGAEVEAGGVSDFTKSAELMDRAERDGLFDVLARERPWLADRQLVTEPGVVYEYAVVLRTNLRKRGTLSNVVVIEPVPPPAAPSELLLDPQEAGIVLTWVAPEMEPTETVTDAPEPTTDAEAADTPTEGAAEEPAEEADEEEAAPPAPEAPKLAFNVYRAIDDKDFAPDPLNPNPIRETTWSDPDVGTGVTYRYVVRSVLDVGGTSVLSAASEEVSFPYRDIFPPDAPSGLRLIPQGGVAVNVLWNPNTERDLAGYAVYRRTDGGEWRRLDAGNLRSASYVDRKLSPGSVYEYSVTAYDGADPPNESERGKVLSVTIPGP